MLFLSLSFYGLWRCCLGLWRRSEKEAILSQMRHEKRSLAALNEHFRNEIWLQLGPLELAIYIQTASKVMDFIFNSRPCVTCTK